MAAGLASSDLLYPLKSDPPVRTVERGVFVRRCVARALLTGRAREISATTGVDIRLATYQQEGLVDDAAVVSLDHTRLSVLGPVTGGLAAE
jgi:hypothetical protein